MSIGDFIRAATERAKAKKDIRSKKKMYRKQGRAAAKTIRSSGVKGKELRGTLKANRVFHNTDKEGNPGGIKAFGAMSARQASITKKRDERKAARNDT
jgi:hypothetical protein